ncbi:MAG TPA: VWA domain-containing protein [Acidobacteriota bacterium]|nr:VWA domain-containing protein [Acidobacteriota bacterium]
MTRLILGFALFLALYTSCQTRAQQAQQDQELPRFGVETEVVRVPISVVGEDGQLYTELTRDNFRVKEQGALQEIVSFAGGESPLTIVLLLEYSRIVTYIRSEVLRPAGLFISQILKPEDYASIVAFDTSPEVLVDFTRNRQELMSAVNSLLYSVPAFSDSSLFDAVVFTVAGGKIEDIEYKGLGEVEGRTAVLLVATGLNTFSRHTYDEARRAVANSGVPIYSIGVGELAFIRAEPYLSGLQRLSFLQAQNQLRTFAQESGGRFYSVRFAGALGGVLDSIAKMMRFQYMIGYRPPKGGKGGEKREIEVEVDIDGDGAPDNDQLDLSYRRYYVIPK